MLHDKKSVVIIRDVKRNDVGIATQRLEFDSVTCTSLLIENGVLNVR